MIHEIHADNGLPKFKAFQFKDGLNVILAQKSDGATSGQTRNRAGKSSFVETVHFLLGADTGEKTPYSSSMLKKHRFGMTLDIAGKAIVVERENATGGGVLVDGIKLTQREWCDRLGQKFFSLPEEAAEKSAAPSFRSLFSYFARRQSAQGFSDPRKHTVMQSTGEQQTALMYLLGMDWMIAREWESARELEKSHKVLKKAAKDGAFGNLLGKSGELQTDYALASERLERLRRNLENFHVLPEYHELEKEADEKSREIGRLTNENTLDLASIKTMREAQDEEAAPEQSNLEALFREAAVTLPEIVKRRYEEVREFHASVIRNRRDYLTGEIAAAESRTRMRNEQLKELNARLQTIMALLKNSGALDQFVKLQAEVGKLQSNVEWLRERLKHAKALEGTKAQLGLRRNALELRLQANFDEQSERIIKAIRAYEDISSNLYESAGRLRITAGDNGPEFGFESPGNRSKGIQNMEMFCFDMMLMTLCSERKLGPRFLIHDSHLFDGVDGRQLTSAMKVGSEISRQLGFQYIVTLNEDDAFKETIPDFDLNQYVLPMRLTDATEDGGFFGFRFE
jgi:uncharacterized protein YydD (DUF2326 family)